MNYCLEKSKLMLNFFKSVYFNQNNTNIEKVEDNKATKNSKLIFYMDCFTSIQHFCIPFDIAIEVIAVAYWDEYWSFTKYYKIVARLWYIQRLI